MALHKLTITVVDGGKGNANHWGSSASESTGTGKRKTGSDFKKILNHNQTMKENITQATSPATLFAKQAFINLAMQTARQAINYHISDIGRRNGDSNYQAIINRKIEVGTDIASFIGSVAGGAATGGPVGAVIGAASASINIGFRQAERLRSYQHEMFQQSTTQNYLLARTSNTGLTGRLR